MRHSGLLSLSLSLSLSVSVSVCVSVCFYDVTFTILPRREMGSGQGKK